MLVSLFLINIKESLSLKVTIKHIGRGPEYAGRSFSRHPPMSLCRWVDILDVRGCPTWLTRNELGRAAKSLQERKRLCVCWCEEGLSFVKVIIQCANIVFWLQHEYRCEFCLSCLWMHVSISWGKKSNHRPQGQKFSHDLSSAWNLSLMSLIDVFYNLGI